MLPVWRGDSQDVWRSDRLLDTRRVPLPSLVKPGRLCTAAWLELLCLSSASPTNQKLIEAARSSCCYSNRQHWLTPLENMFFGIPVAVGVAASPSQLLHPHCLQCSSCYFLQTVHFYFFYYAWCTSLVAHEFVIIAGRGDQEKKVVVIRVMPLQEF